MSGLTLFERKQVGHINRLKADVKHARWERDELQAKLDAALAEVPPQEVWQDENERLFHEIQQEQAKLDKVRDELDESWVKINAVLAIHYKTTRDTCNCCGYHHPCPTAIAVGAER